MTEIIIPDRADILARVEIASESRWLRLYKFAHLEQLLRARKVSFGWIYTPVHKIEIRRIKSGNAVIYEIDYDLRDPIFPLTLDEPILESEKWATDDVEEIIEYLRKILVENRNRPIKVSLEEEK